MMCEWKISLCCCELLICWWCLSSQDQRAVLNNTADQRQHASNWCPSFRTSSPFIPLTTVSVTIWRMLSFSPSSPIDFLLLLEKYPNSFFWVQWSRKACPLPASQTLPLTPLSGHSLLAIPVSFFPWKGNCYWMRAGLWPSCSPYFSSFFTWLSVPQFSGITQLPNVSSLLSVTTSSITVSLSYSFYYTADKNFCEILKIAWHADNKMANV